MIKISVLQIVDIVLELCYKLGQRNLKVEVLHALSDLEPRLIQELFDD